MKTEMLKVRVDSLEKQAFEQAAAIAGLRVSVWIRERLRLTAIRELESAGRSVPFIPPMRMGGGGDVG